MALLLSCRSLLCAILYSCASLNYIDHGIVYSNMIVLCRALPVSFCFVENMDITPLPRDIIATVFPRQYLRTSYEAYTHNFTTEMSQTLKESFSLPLPLIYFNTHLSFTQFYLSFFLVCVVSNPTAVCMSWRALSLMTIICATVW